MNTNEVMFERGWCGCSIELGDIHPWISRSSQYIGSIIGLTFILEIQCLKQKLYIRIYSFANLFI
jgi:hypothetical protein